MNTCARFMILMGDADTIIPPPYTKIMVTENQIPMAIQNLSIEMITEPTTTLEKSYERNIKKII